MNTRGFSNKSVPYIGVTDFMSHDQVLQAVAAISEDVFRRLHVGHMMSYKTYHGIPTETGWENIWLRGEKLEALFQPHPKVFNVLHFADYSHPYSLTDSSDLIGACKECGPYLQGLQLDMIWPRASLIQEVKSAFPHLEIILQLGKTSLQILEKSEGFFDLELERYSKYVDYFLIDWGMGKGQPMDLEMVGSYLDMSCEVLSQEKIAVAGGLGPHTYEVIRGFLQKYPLVSCDAQGQMRSTCKATDPIEMERVCEYIQGVCSLLS